MRYVITSIYPLHIPHIYIQIVANPYISWTSKKKQIIFLIFTSTIFLICIHCFGYEDMKWSVSWLRKNLVNWVESEILVLLKIIWRQYFQTNTPTFPFWTPLLPPRLWGAFMQPQFARGTPLVGFVLLTNHVLLKDNLLPVS